MGVTRRTSWMILLAVAAASAGGCASTPSKPTTNISDEFPDLPHKPALTTDGQAGNNERVVVDSVNDTVDRFDKVIRQREAARQAAVDIKETRDLAAAKTKPAEDPSTIEKLAAALRAHKPIDDVPAVKPDGPPLEGKATAAASNQPIDADAKLAAVDPNPKQPDATMSGALGTPTGVRLETPDDAPSIGRGSSVDPMLAVQDKLMRKVAGDPRDAGAQFDLQVARFLKGEPIPNMTDLSALPSEDRELLAAVCDAMSNYRSVVTAMPNPMASEKSRPFLEMADRIRTRSDLTITGLTLCDKVMGFGSYDKIDPLVFSAGTPRKVVLYCEVDGFLSQLNANQKWETKLSLGLKLFDDHGLQVWEVPADTVTDSVMRRRRDFFLNRLITLPANLPGGHYMLKASVQDVQANRIAQQTIQFAVNPKEPVAQ